MLDIFFKGLVTHTKRSCLEAISNEDIQGNFVSSYKNESHKSLKG
jgi:hypothetical protein